MPAIAFSDLYEGQQFALEPYELTREELLAFATEFDPQPFHLDAVAAQSSVLGGLAASGWHTASIMMRMICDALFSKLDTLGSTGIDEIKWLKPVYVGDVLSGTLTITGARTSRTKPDIGIFTFDVDVHDQHGVAKASLRSMGRVRIAP
jgi:acyl dehydratase